MAAVGSGQGDEAGPVEVHAVIVDKVRVLPRILTTGPEPDLSLVFVDSVEWPYAEDLTADFVFIRLHGSEELYASGYSDEALDHWAARIKLWANGLQPNDSRLAAPDLPPPQRSARDVLVYFDNDANVRAPFDARALRAKLS